MVSTSLSSSPSNPTSPLPRRIPFYYTTKTLFLLYLALPQSQGASYLYIAHLRPFFQTHEIQIDEALAQLKARAYAFVQERMRAVWEAVAATIGGQQAQQAPVTGSATAAPPTLGDPVSGPVQMLGGLWRSYGPLVMASGAAMLRPAVVQQDRAQRQQQRQAALTTPPGSSMLFSRGAGTGSEAGTTQSLLERRRQLEAELAALGKEEGSGGVMGMPMPSASPLLHTGADYLELRQRSGSASGRFEEVEVPSDVEGYETSDYDSRKGAGARTSWFSGWGGSAAGGYERVKGE